MTTPIPNGNSNNVLPADLGPKYPDHLPCGKNDPVPETEPFDFYDVALRANPALPVFNQPGVELSKITPLIGTKITGLQLAELDSAGLDQLGLLTAQRGFVIFGSREGHQQNFADVGIPRQLDVGRHFGPLHRHPTLAHPESSDELSCVYADPKSNFAKSLYAGRNTRCVWHHDQAHEHQPPGYTLFACLETPPQGGDTVFANCEEAYRRLSGPMQDFIKDLRMVHTSGHHNMQSGALGMKKRQEVVESAHPLVRKHPVTGNPALFIGKYSVSHIEGLAEEESELMMKFLYDMVASAHDLQARVKWNAGDVCVWDQRVVVHTATVDTEPQYRRHFIRITPLGGVPEIYGKDRPDGKGRGGTKA